MRAGRPAPADRDPKPTHLSGSMLQIGKGDEYRNVVLPQASPGTAGRLTDTHDPDLSYLPNKVPTITVTFWVTKILTTGMGETTSDFLVRQFDPPIVVGVAAALLLAALTAQMAVRRYSIWRYWWAVVMVSIFGTMVADIIHVFVGVPYVISTIVFGTALTVVLVLWYRSEGTLSIDGVRTRRREAYYWGTVLATFALGTAGGDLTASSMGLGYLLSALLFAALFALPLVGERLLGLGEVATFWTAYIVTRPLGASIADWVGVSRERGGLGWGTGLVSLALGLLILAVISLTREANLTSAGQFDVQRRPKR